MTNFPAPPTASHEPTCLEKDWHDPDLRGPSEGWHNNPRADFLREALAEIAESKSLTATPTQFYGLAKTYASSYASPHHITFTVEGLRSLIAAAGAIAQGIEQPALAQLAPIGDELADELHSRIMNMPCKPYDGTDAYTHYCRGHRDARHAAAELVGALLAEAVHPSPAPQEQPEPAGVMVDAPCPTCGEAEPFTGTCGTSPADTKALCNRARGVPGTDKPVTGESNG